MTYMVLASLIFSGWGIKRLLGNKMPKVSGDGDLQAQDATLDGFGVSLRGFVDNSTPESQSATTTSLSEIELWVRGSRRIDVEHVINKNVQPAALGIDTGPFTDEKVVDIVRTVRDHLDNDERRSSDKVDLWHRVLSIPLLGTILKLLFDPSKN